jgi:hypothetical protein
VPWYRLLLLFRRTLEVAVAGSRPLVFPSMAWPLFVVSVDALCSVHADRRVAVRSLSPQDNVCMLCKRCNVSCDAVRNAVLWCG